MLFLVGDCRGRCRDNSRLCGNRTSGGLLDAVGRDRAVSAQVMIGAARTMKHAVTLLGVPFSPHRIAVIGARLIALGASVFSLWAT
jgi:hypothetical protein